MIHPQHHSHIRKRIHLHRYAYPSNKTLVRLLDNWVSVFGVVTSLSVAPQALAIWMNRSAENVSVFTWSVFFLWTFTMLLYGIVHKAKPIIITQSIGIVFYGLIVVGIAIY